VKAQLRLLAVNQTDKQTNVDQAQILNFDCRLLKLLVVQRFCVPEKLFYKIATFNFVRTTSKQKFFEVCVNC